MSDDPREFGVPTCAICGVEVYPPRPGRGLCASCDDFDENEWVDDPPDSEPQDSEPVPCSVHEYRPAFGSVSSNVGDDVLYGPIFLGCVTCWNAYRARTHEGWR